MSMKLDLTGKLDFSEIDLTAPNKVVEEILAQLPVNTNNMVSGEIIAYSGPVVSYKKIRRSFADALGTITSEEQVDIQSDLGKQGETEKKYESFIHSTGNNEYKYRLFFMRYGNAPYPVQLTVEESIARNIQDGSSGYIFTCNNREEVEALVVKILNSKRVINVMQEFVRIYQADQISGIEAVVDETDTE